MFQWGIMSTAKIAQTQLNPAIAASSNGVIAGVASRDIGKAEAMAAQTGAPKSYGSYEAMLDDPDIDGVYIPIHTSGHVEWSLKAAEAGKHVLCEKPIAMHASEIDQLIAMRDAKGVVISEAFMVNYHPQWAKVRELLANGAVGSLRHIDGAFSYFNNDPANMRNSVDLGGGGLRDIGVYPTVTARIATGLEVLGLRARVDLDPQFGTDDYANVTAQMENDVTLDFYCATQLGLRQLMVFHGDKGSIEVTAPFNPPGYGQAQVHLFDAGRDRAEVFRFKEVNQYVLQVEEFVRATQGQGTVFSLESSKQNQAVIDACFVAGQTGDWVDL